MFIGGSKMEELKWYENASLESIRNIIRSNIQTVSMSFNAIGYYLKNVRDRNLHKEAGYSSILEFAHAEFGISQSWANRWMDINDRFSVDGNSPILQEQYKEYKSSNLAEMLTLTDAQLEQVTHTTTRNEIREMKKHKVKEVAPAQVEEPIKATQVNKALAKEVALFCLGYLWDELRLIVREKGLIDFSKILEDRMAGQSFISGENRMEFLKAYIRVPKDSEIKKTDYDYLLYSDISLRMHSEWNTVAILKFPELMIPVTESTNIVTDELENVTEIAEIVTNQDEIELSCDTCNWDVKGCCNYGSPKLDWCTAGDKWTPKVEIVEAEIIQSETYDELSLAKEILDRKQGQLKSWLRISNPSAYEILSIEKIKIEIGALACYMTDLDNVVNPIPVPEQPELPILKNNDQRKEFIDNYISWPVWIDQVETGEKFYRYNLTDLVAIVVKVSKKHEYKNYKETKDFEYAAEQYYLLGVKSEWSQKGSKFVEDDTRTFYECNTNKSALTEYLKEFQKKGV